MRAAKKKAVVQFARAALVYVIASRLLSYLDRRYGLHLEGGDLTTRFLIACVIVTVAVVAALHPIYKYICCRIIEE